MYNKTIGDALCVKYVVATMLKTRSLEFSRRLRKPRATNPTRIFLNVIIVVPKTTLAPNFRKFSAPKFAINYLFKYLLCLLRR